ncbi:MAG: GNAT family N-acetyltransferase [Bacteroidales bacterium]|nr:GNAT family N-acetyltransferase [Bacteroidales bacterium]
MKSVIKPVDVELLKQELTEDKILRRTNALNNIIYMVDAHDSPNLLREIGRLRELTFRAAGGGTGKELDLDEFDEGPHAWKQLIVWNPEEEEIVSAYRFVKGADAPVDEKGYPHTATSELFEFSPRFIQDQWQRTIELGRSFVQPKYQVSADPRKGLFALDNIWDGLGALAVKYPEIEYFFGKMTMYNTYSRLARRLILDFLKRYFQGDENLVKPFHSTDRVKKISQKNTAVFKEKTLGDSLSILKKRIRAMGTVIPPLIKSYMSISPSLKYFGISDNPNFGEVEELAIMIHIPEIYENKRERHIASFIKSK